MQIVCQTHGVGEGEVICSKCVELAEQKINSIQQLKAEILALRKEGVVADDMYWVGWNMAIERAAGVLKLSAV
jgi:hypothetical protein